MLKINVIKRFPLITLLGFLLAGLIFSGLSACSATPALAGPPEQRKTSRIEYHDEWRKLWEDHITWTRSVIIGILDDLPGTSLYVDRLLLNYEDMEEALRPYYRNDAELLGALIQDHLVIAAEMLTAANSGDTAAFEEAKTRWYANGEEIAAKMSEVNPEFWPLEETHHMWIEHLDATLEEATAHLTGDYAGEVAAYDLVHDLALEMADYMSAGIMMQFPEKFQGPQP
jgi:hypothetical protein